MTEHWLFFLFFSIYYVSFFIGPFVYKKFTSNAKAFYISYNAIMIATYLIIPIAIFFLKETIVLYTVVIIALVLQSTIHSISMILLVYLLKHKISKDEKTYQKNVYCLFCLLYTAGVSVSTYIDGLIQDGNYRTFYLLPACLAILMHICFMVLFMRIRFFFDDITLAFIRKKRSVVKQSEPFRKLIWAFGFLLMQPFIDTDYILLYYQKQQYTIVNWVVPFLSIISMIINGILLLLSKLIAIYYIAEAFLIATNIFSMVIYFEISNMDQSNVLYYNSCLYSLSFIGLYLYLFIIILVKMPQKRIKLAFIVLYVGMYIDFVIEYFSVYWVVGTTCIYFAVMLLFVFISIMANR